MLNFWPVLAPLALYLLWYFLLRRRARRAGERAPHPLSGPWFLTLLAMTGIAALCFFYWGWNESATGEKGRYVPARIGEDGRIIPGHIAP